MPVTPEYWTILFLIMPVLSDVESNTNYFIFCGQNCLTKFIDGKIQRKKFKQKKKKIKKQKKYIDIRQIKKEKCGVE